MNWRSARKIFAVFLASSLTSGCNAQQPSPEWNGTWRLNPSKGNFQGPIIKISISPDGGYRYADEYSSFTFRCDGKDQPIGSDLTRACVKDSATVLDLTRKENGVKTGVSHWELSADGKVLTVTATAFRPSGPVATGQVVASRLSGSSDVAGEWRDTSYLQRHADMPLRLDAQTLHISYPSAGQYIDAPLNERDATVRGPHAESLAYAARLVSRHEFLILTKRDGKVLLQTSRELSSDGRVITESWWNPDRPTDKGVLVYEKQ